MRRQKSYLNKFLIATAVGLAVGVILACLVNGYSWGFVLSHFSQSLA
jgi:hypothetical protein